MIELTREQAIEIAESNVWKNWTADQVVRFQLYQPLLCMDFAHYHKCVEEVLGRSVWTHEFAYDDNLRKEYEGKKPKTTMDEIIGLLSEFNDKLIIIQ